MERLSGLDSAFLSLETPAMHLHVAIAAVIDPSTMAAPYSFEQLKEFAAERLLAHAAFRRRVVEVPFRLNHPIWVEDPDLDVDYHIRRHVLPAPGGARELTELVGSIVGVPLERSHPLWEIHVIEGLHDGNVALLGKIHHAAVDGVSGAELFIHLFDLTPEPEPRPPAPDPATPERIPSDAELVGHALWSQVRRTVSLPALVGRTVRTAGHLVSRHRDPEAVVGAVPLRAPRTPWSAAITPHRAVAFARVRLSDVRRVKDAFGVKVNDVVLAVTSAALRRYLIERGTLPAEPLVAMCPVSVRDEDGKGVADNRVSAMFVHLQTDVADPGDRLRAIARATRGAKEDHHAVGARFLQNWAEHAAPSTFALAARLYSRLNIADHHAPLHNLVVSNVPGPDLPLYLDGAELVAAYPMGPVSEGAGLNVTVLSYRDNVDFGLLAAAELVPDVWDMADHVDEAMAELVALATPEPAPEPAPEPEPASRRNGAARPASATSARAARPRAAAGGSAKKVGAANRATAGKRTGKAGGAPAAPSGRRGSAPAAPAPPPDDPRRPDHPVPNRRLTVP
ncbi:MAG TPA: wax ester/triacylglycerol synthase family O-acyltransferase [Acidimicrobiales bacterium]|nr:wax ester/triacylglycerol synthase family O-acyltransferase [Acidimicrobiales bacterium]